jgi:hypothetical protein
MVALEAAMADLERSRTDFERKALAVGAALRQLQQDVVQADAPVTAQREELGAELRKRRRLSGAAAPPAGQRPHWHIDMHEEKRPFDEAAEEVEEKLQGVSHALARVHVTVQQARASVDAAKAEAASLLGPARLAAAREVRNGSCSALLEMLGRSDLGRPNHAAVLGKLSLAAVWRLRGVSRAFRSWCGSALAAMPRVVAVGGSQRIYGVKIFLATAVSLDLATLAWGGESAVPDLPAPCVRFSLGQLPGGRLVAAGGSTDGHWRSALTAAAIGWAPGHAAWTPLPPMGTERHAPVVAVLSDGRMLVAGGANVAGGVADGAVTLASVEVLAADGSGWAALPPMATARGGAVAGRLPGGQVIVAGGYGGSANVPVASAELWDPATGAWAQLPPMTQDRYGAAGCVLPSGRFAVLGGGSAGLVARGDAEAFDPVSRAWQPLPRMPLLLEGGAAVAVAGGLLVVGGMGHAGAMLFDEESGRWFTLPGQMPAGREDHVLITVPTAP